MRISAVARVAGHCAMILEGAFVDGEHHLHHLARGLFGLLVVLLKRALHVAVFALNPKRGGDELHRRDELVCWNPFQDLDVLEGLIGRFRRRWRGPILSTSERGQECDHQPGNGTRQESRQNRPRLAIHSDFPSVDIVEVYQTVPYVRLLGQETGCRYRAKVSRPELTPNTPRNRPAICGSLGPGLMLACQWRITLMKCVLHLLVFVALATTCIADSIVYVRVYRPLIEEHLKLAQDGEAERVRTLRNLFQKARCPQVLEQEVPKEEFPNLICLLPGDEEGTIIVGASLDYAPDEADAPARWSTLALLPLLAESLSSAPHRLTLMFIAFTGHEHGMRGANWYLNQLTETQRKPIQAMIDLDNLGRTPAVYALAQSDRTLAKWLQVAAVSLQLPNPPRVDASTANLPLQNGALAVKDEDLWANAKPFEHEHIPAIAVQSATPAMLPALRQQGALPDRVYRNRL